MLRRPCRCVLSVGVLAAGLGLAACGSAPTPLPTEYVQFDYTVTPPGTTTGQNPIVLTVGPPPMSTDPTCQRDNQKIVVYASQGVATITMTLVGPVATNPGATNLQATTQSAGVAEVALDIPIEIDDMGNYANPASFKSTNPSNSLTCFIDLKGPDPFASFDGSFTCQSNSTDPGRHLELTAGQFHAVPCPASGG